MTKMTTRFSLGALVGAALLATSTVAQEVTVFRNVSVIPMDTERVLDAQTVVVRGERIESISAAAGAQTPQNARVIDGSGRYLVPGLAEMHAHVPPGDDPQYVEEVLFLYVANGVTTARGMLGTPSHLGLRERLARHEVLGPRLVTSGPALNGQQRRQSGRRGAHRARASARGLRFREGAIRPHACGVRRGGAGGRGERHQIGGPRAGRRRCAARDRGEASDDRSPRPLRRGARARSSPSRKAAFSG